MKKREDDPNLPQDLGDETGDASSPRPDENVVDEIGAEVGVEWGSEEPVHATVDKVGRRDDHRWELDPASSEDYEDREKSRMRLDEE